MTIRREILDVSRRQGLYPSAVEKDYLLGWLLWGISQHRQLSESLVFKGGTCLKKCFAETYRLSEDLDFTLTEFSHFDEEFLRDAFREIADRICEEADIVFPQPNQEFHVYENRHGNRSCQGKVSYRGPVSPKRGAAPRIKMDITLTEKLVLPPCVSEVFHPYSHSPDGGITVKTYQYVEVVAEKTRALAQRSTGRDLYDLMRVFRDPALRPDAHEVLEVLKEKCDFKGIGLPDMNQLESRRSEFERSWYSDLKHQTVHVPPIENYLNDLPRFLDWILCGGDPVSLDAPDSIDPLEMHTLIKDRVISNQTGTKVQGLAEHIRFAAANRICVDITHGGETERVEAYSLRRGWDGEAVLHAHEISSDQTRMYRMNDIQEVVITDQAFTPRYRSELDAEHPGQATPSVSRAGRGAGSATDGPGQHVSAG